MSKTSLLKAQPGQDQDERLLLLAVRREISQVSDKDELMAAIQDRAKRLVQARKLDNAQVRNLENIAYSTEKISDITDYLKQQIGRSNSNERWRYQDVGQDILTDLTGQNLPTEPMDKPRFLMRAQVEEIVGRLSDKYSQAWSDELRRRIYLGLCREYVRHLTANYLYLTTQAEPVNQAAQRKG
jgi:hypothetical protein